MHEIPGMSHYDRYENALSGINLQEAKRVAKETHPIAPQLDVCRLLVGQDKLPNFSTSSSPSENIFAQIGILDHGLKFGGNIHSLIGLRNEVIRLSPSSGEHSPYCWSKQRVFVSPFANSKCCFKWSHVLIY